MVGWGGAVGWGDAGGGEVIAGWGERKTIAAKGGLSPENNIDTQTGRSVSRLNFSFTVERESHKQSPWTTTFEKKGELRQNRTLIRLLASLRDRDDFFQQQ